MSRSTLILPGIGDSGPDHWQTLWEKQDPSFVRVRQSDWEHPVCEVWVDTLESTLRRLDAETVLVAHSLGCLLVAHWAAKTRIGAKGALLVAPPDPKGPHFPKEALGFAPVPLEKLVFPSIVVASADDLYASIRFSACVAAAWGSRFINVGSAGHINSRSGLGEWSEGLSILRQLMDEDA